MLPPVSQLSALPDKKCRYSAHSDCVSDFSPSHQVDDCPRKSRLRPSFISADLSHPAAVIGCSGDPGLRSLWDGQAGHSPMLIALREADGVVRRRQSSHCPARPLHWPVVGEPEEQRCHQHQAEENPQSAAGRRDRTFDLCIPQQPAQPTRRPLSLLAAVTGSASHTHCSGCPVDRHSACVTPTAPRSRADSHAGDEGAEQRCAGRAPKRCDERCIERGGLQARQLPRQQQADGAAQRVGAGSGRWLACVSSTLAHDGLLFATTSYGPPRRPQSHHAAQSIHRLDHVVHHQQHLHAEA